MNFLKHFIGYFITLILGFLVGTTYGVVVTCNTAGRMLKIQKENMSYTPAIMLGQVELTEYA